MGRVRNWAFSAVVGVGGKRPDRGHEEIARKVNWVGIGPYKVGDAARGPRLAFDYFLLMEGNGPDLKESAPCLFRYMFEDRHVRAVLSQNLPDKAMQDEVQAILRWAAERKQLRTPPYAITENLPTKRRC